MSERDAQILEQGTRVQTSKSPDSTEERLIRMLDEKRALEKYEAQIKKLEKGTLDLPGFLKQLSIPMIQKILYTIEVTKDDRLRLTAAQDLLDRAGYGKINKAVVAHSNLDFRETKRELVNSVITLARKSGIKVKEADYVEGDDTVVDVTPSVPNDSGEKGGGDPV